MILEILLIVIACLLALLLYWFYYSLLVAVLQKAHPEMDLTLWQLSELNEGLTQFELWKALHSDQNIADQKLSEFTREQPNTTPQAQYEAYKKRGGTDSYPTFLQMSELDELFP